jgi:hypothetical protein
MHNPASDVPDPEGKGVEVLPIDAFLDRFLEPFTEVVVTFTPEEL